MTGKFDGMGYPADVAADLNARQEELMVLTRAVMDEVGNEPADGRYDRAVRRLRQRFATTESASPPMREREAVNLINDVLAERGLLR